MSKITLCIGICAIDYTAERAIIASNVLFLNNFENENTKKKYCTNSADSVEFN